jgi:hypothetical protein
MLGCRTYPRSQRGIQDVSLSIAACPPPQLPFFSAFRMTIVCTYSEAPAMFNCCARKEAQDLFFGSNARSSMADAAKGSREANCPWCFELSCFYTVGRSLIWVCDYCKGLCEPDEGNTALIRRDPLKSNNEKSGYHLPKVFKSFQTKKHAMFARSHSRTQTLEDLTRASPQREQASAAGVLRPFMILVSMPIVTRAQLAVTLGFSLITEPIFGRPHEEAWEILNRPQVRLLAPSSKKLSPLTLDTLTFRLV